MADDVYGFGADDVRRLRRALDFVESFMRRDAMRREGAPGAVQGIDYITGTLAADLDFHGTAMLTLDSALDDETTEIEVYGRWFSAPSGEKVGATFNPFTDQYDADRRECEQEDSDDQDGGNASGGGDTEDGGDPVTPTGDLDGGTP